jgi:hypothetical protein
MLRYDNKKNNHQKQGHVRAPRKKRSASSASGHNGRALEEATKTFYAAHDLIRDAQIAKWHLNECRFKNDCSPCAAPSSARPPVDDIANVTLSVLAVKDVALQS